MGGLWPSGTPDGLDVDGVVFLPEIFIEFRGAVLETPDRGVV